MTGIISLLDKLRSRRLKLVTAESCTGGMIAAAITDVPGSSDVFDRGFVTYSNQSKIDLLGVRATTLEKFGAVSAETCREMMSGALKNSQADIAIASTGIAGPSGGSEEKPVGLVYIGISGNAVIRIEECFFEGDREAVRMQAVERAFELLADSL